jgi:two-component system phosphate regulon sensor histidine kinase PhoR
VDDLFDVSRFEHGTLPLKPERTCLQDLILNVVEVQHPEAQRREIHLDYTLPGEPLYAEVDPPRLVQVMTNLVTNAIAYTHSGGQVNVGMTADHEDETVTISVQDTGIGIPQGWLDQIFTPFFRGHDHSTGAGLGLSISREIVELHAGSISVESTVGVGTRFDVRLRLAPHVETEGDRQPA